MLKLLGKKDRGNFAAVLKIEEQTIGTSQCPLGKIVQQNLFVPARVKIYLSNSCYFKSIQESILPSHLFFLNATYCGFISMHFQRLNFF